jgi:hypothetical protein
MIVTYLVRDTRDDAETMPMVVVMVLSRLVGQKMQAFA